MHFRETKSPRNLLTPKFAKCKKNEIRESKIRGKKMYRNARKIKNMKVYFTRNEL